MITNRTFNLLWLGQLISNLGTQISFYGIGLWLFSKSGNIKDFALVAIVVQIARLLSLPFITNSIKKIPRKTIMLLSNFFGAFCTLILAFILFNDSNNFNLYLLLIIQGLASSADAVMIISFSSLIPLLANNSQELKKANGIFASTDNLILTISPFLGSWLSGLLGVKGVIIFDFVSFLLAITCILFAQFNSMLIYKISLLNYKNKTDFYSLRKIFSRMWKNSNCFYFVFILTITISCSYASTEILFPAWVATAYGTSRMGMVLLIAAVGYFLGFTCWNLISLSSLKKNLVIAISVQSLILMASGLSFFENKLIIWMLGVFVFSLFLPIVTSTIQYIWSKLTPTKYLADLFAIRYAGEWSARLVSFIFISMLVDNLIEPFLFNLNLPTWVQVTLGETSGREIAVSLGLIGWLLLLGMIVCQQRRCNLQV